MVWLAWASPACYHQHDLTNNHMRVNKILWSPPWRAVPGLDSSVSNPFLSCNSDPEQKPKEKNIPGANIMSGYIIEYFWVNGYDEKMMLAADQKWMNGEWMADEEPGNSSILPRTDHTRRRNLRLCLGFSACCCVTTTYLLDYLYLRLAAFFPSFLSP